MRAANEAISPASSTTNGYLSSLVPTSYADSLPHSTQSALNHITTTDQSGLQRRLNDMGGLKSIKAKQKIRPPKLGGMGGMTGAGGGGGAGAVIFLNMALGMGVGFLERVGVGHGG